MPRAASGNVRPPVPSKPVRDVGVAAEHRQRGDRHELERELRRRPTLPFNGYGEQVGIVFDGNYEGLGNDIFFFAEQLPQSYGAVMAP